MTYVAFKEPMRFKRIVPTGDGLFQIVTFTFHVIYFVLSCSFLRYLNCWLSGLGYGLLSHKSCSFCLPNLISVVARIILYIYKLSPVSQLAMNRDWSRKDNSPFFLLPVKLRPESTGESKFVPLTFLNYQDKHKISYLNGIP